MYLPREQALEQHLCKTACLGQPGGCPCPLVNRCCGAVCPLSHRCVSSVFPWGGVALHLGVSWRGETALWGWFSHGLSMAFVYGDR